MGPGEASQPVTGRCCVEDTKSSTGAPSVNGGNAWKMGICAEVGDFHRGAVIPCLLSLALYVENTGIPHRGSTLEKRGRR